MTTPAVPPFRAVLKQALHSARRPAGQDAVEQDKPRPPRAHHAALNHPPAVIAHHDRPFTLPIERHRMLSPPPAVTPRARAPPITPAVVRPGRRDTHARQGATHATHVEAGPRHRLERDKAAWHARQRLVVTLSTPAQRRGREISERCGGRAGGAHDTRGWPRRGPGRDTGSEQRLDRRVGGRWGLRSRSPKRAPAAIPVCVRRPLLVLRRRDISFSVWRVPRAPASPGCC
jgi:hypothetical protein